jgi:hypothetical protein
LLAVLGQFLAAEPRRKIALRPAQASALVGDLPALALVVLK